MSPIESVIDSAQVDSCFRESLIANPSQVLHDSGCQVPENKRIEVIDTQPGEIHLSLGMKGASSKVQTVLDRAEKDATFRQLLLANPKSVFEREMGQALPAGISIFVHQPDAQCLRLLLPPLRQESTELSAAELETVAGGGLFKNMLNYFCKDTQIVINQPGPYGGDHQIIQTTVTDASIGAGTSSSETIWV